MKQGNEEDSKDLEMGNYMKEHTSHEKCPSDLIDSNFSTMIVPDSKHIEKNIRKKFKEGSPLSSTCCIYKIQRDIRRWNEMAYSPLLISIGPFYRGHEKLMPAEEEKLMYLKSFITRHKQLQLRHYIEVVKDMEEMARQCYSKAVILDSDEFVEMLLVDGVFILEFFIRHSDPKLVDKRDRIIWQGVRGIYVFKDMLLLENQIPFFVLQGLYNQLGLEQPLYELLFEVFEVFSSVTNLITIDGSIWRMKPDKYNPLHLLDYLRICYLPNPLVKRSHDESETPPSYLRKISPNNYEISVSATSLQEAGVDFTVKTNASPLDINFSDGVLEIPKLVIGNFTEIIFRNLMAFEQYHYDGKTYIIDYIAFLDSLIDTPMDVDVLVRNHILVNGLGSNNELSEMVNNLTRNTMMEQHLFCYTELCCDINRYARRPWNRWKAMLRRDYFNSPWTIISLVAAIFLLVLTVIQAAASINSWK